MDCEGRALMALASLPDAMPGCGNSCAALPCCTLRARWMVGATASAPPGWPADGGALAAELVMRCPHALTAGTFLYRLGSLLAGRLFGLSA